MLSNPTWLLGITGFDCVDMTFAVAIVHDRVACKIWRGAVLLCRRRFEDYHQNERSDLRSAVVSSRSNNISVNRGSCGKINWPVHFGKHLR